MPALSKAKPLALGAGLVLTYWAAHAVPPRRLSQLIKQGQ